MKFKFQIASALAIVALLALVGATSKNFYYGTFNGVHIGDGSQLTGLPGGGDVTSAMLAGATNSTTLATQGMATKAYADAKTNTSSLVANGLVSSAQLGSATTTATLVSQGLVSSAQLGASTTTSTLVSQGLVSSAQLGASTTTATLVSQGLVSSAQLGAATTTATLASQGMATKAYSDATTNLSTGDGSLVRQDNATLNNATLSGTTAASDLTASSASITNAVFQSPVQETNAASGNYSWFGVDATNTIVFTNRYGQVVAAVSTNGIPIFPALAVGGVLTNGAGGVVSNTTVLPATMMSTTPTNDLNTTLRAYVVTVTNRPALYVDRSNVLSGVLTFPSSSNSVSVYPGGADWILVSATPVSFTNCTGALAGYVCSAYLTTSNSTAAAFTNFCTIPNAYYIGSAATNAAIVPSGKEAMWLVETRGINRTNVYGPLISQ